MKTFEEILEENAATKAAVRKFLIEYSDDKE